MNLETYLNQIRKLDQQVADQTIVPDRFAETVYRRSSQTIMNWKKKGQNGPLSVIKIDNGTYITATCLITKINENRSRIDLLKEKLLERLRQFDVLGEDEIDEVTVYYGEAMEWVGMSVGVPADRSDFGYIAGAVSRETWASSNPKFMLSAMVTRQDWNMPGEGFYPLAEDLTGETLEEEDHVKFVNKQIRLAWEFAQSTKHG